MRVFRGDVLVPGGFYRHAGCLLWVWAILPGDRACVAFQSEDDNRVVWVLSEAAITGTPWARLA